MTVYRSSTSTDATTPGQPVPVRRGGLRLPLRWVLALLAVVLLGNLLLVEAYANARFAPDSAPGTAGAGATVPAAVRDGGPVIDTTGEQPRSLRTPPGTVVLTFDDGPDPTWTPQVLEVLAKHRVQATFFVVGSQVTRYPELARRLVREGHEIGAHTFSHPKLAGMPAWRQ
ncbi:MAG TPA: polysaccharide deacetylase family protein, partial [Micromonosporaceae bacterium]|nr:polysaccharide deacetylase family protein [Micromonosporaceae bacterium]